MKGVTLKGVLFPQLDFVIEESLHQTSAEMVLAKRSQSRRQARKFIGDYQSRKWRVTVNFDSSVLFVPVRVISWIVLFRQQAIHELPRRNTKQDTEIGQAGSCVVGEPSADSH